MVADERVAKAAIYGLNQAGRHTLELEEAWIGPICLIDWMLHLRLDLSRQFETELVAYEKELHMPYVTPVERIAEERGLERMRWVGMCPIND